MQKPAEERALDEAPLYIRWNPDRSGYAIELRLDLVQKILGELTKAEKANLEVGGVLVGSLPTDFAPILRIDDVEMVPRSPDDSPIYMLGPHQHERFSEARRKARAAGRTAVGFFRSHLRPGSLRPSLADRSLLSAEFKQAVYAILLIEGSGGHAAAFFVATKGRFPEEPAVREFRFDQAEFNALPEIPAERLPVEAESAPKQPSKLGFYATILALLLIGAGACALLWSLGGRSELPSWFGASSQVQLGVSRRNNVLRISWNHAADEFAHASEAMLIIRDGASSREIRLGLDELRLGAVDYVRASPHVRVTMTVNAPGSTPRSESVDWTPGSSAP